MSESAPTEPTSHAAPDAGPDGEAPPSPPEETSVAPEPERYFEVAGKSWIARVSGSGAAGTGAYGLGLIEAIHFYDAAAPDRPVSEALIARHRFASLFDAELADLLARATPIVLPES